MLDKSFSDNYISMPCNFIRSRKKQRLALSIINKLYNSKYMCQWLVKPMNGKTSDNVVMQNNKNISHCRNYKAGLFGMHTPDN